jgi:hypothetical protein
MDGCRAHARAEEWRQFDEVLRELKRQGANLLVTGEVPASVTRTAARTMLGDPGEPRRRVLAFPEPPGDALHEYLPPGVTVASDDVWVASLGADVRRPASAEAMSPSNVSDLAGFRSEIVGAVSFYDDVTDGLDPAELRLGVESLSMLFAEYRRDAVERFLRTTTAIVRGVNGMGHYRLARPDRDDLVQSLAPLFDVRVELRQRGDRPPEHRWHVVDEGITTSWVQL